MSKDSRYDQSPKDDAHGYHSQGFVVHINTDYRRNGRSQAKQGDDQDGIPAMETAAENKVVQMPAVARLNALSCKLAAQDRHAGVEDRNGPQGRGCCQRDSRRTFERASYGQHPQHQPNQHAARVAQENAGRGTVVDQKSC